jgi:hypothetical protein
VAVHHVATVQQLKGDIEYLLAGALRSSGEVGVGGEVEPLLDRQSGAADNRLAVVRVQVLPKMDLEVLRVQNWLVGTRVDEHRAGELHVRGRSKGPLPIV